MKKTDALKLIVNETGKIERRIKRLENKLTSQHELMEGIDKLTIGLTTGEITPEQVVEYFQPEKTETEE